MAVKISKSEEARFALTPWEVLDYGICFDRFATEAEANTIAGRLRKTHTLHDTLKGFAATITEYWTKEDRKFAREYFGPQFADIIEI